MKHLKFSASVVVFMLMLMPLVSFAANNGEQKGIHEVGTGIENPGLKEAGQGTGQGAEIQNETMLQNQGEEQQNTVQQKQNTQAGQKDEKGNKTDANGQNQASEKAVQRRNKVASAVQEMLQVAERNQGVGQQIKVIAQTQNQDQNQIEIELKQVKNRGQLKKFFFGPDYKNLNLAEDKLTSYEEKLEVLKKLTSQITNEADATKLQELIGVMEQVGVELEEELTDESEGFSLFGWLNRMLSK